MAASTSNPSCIVEVGEKYPYPSHNFSTNIVTVKLSDKSKYNVWKIQLLCLLSSHGMLGFINGKFASPDGKGKGKVGDMEAWIRSDSLVKGWILGSLSEEAAFKVVSRLIHKNTNFNAKDAWDEVQHSYGPSLVRQQAAVINSSIEEEEEIRTRETDSIITEGNSTTRKLSREILVEVELNSRDKELQLIFENLHKYILKGNSEFVLCSLKREDLTPMTKITNNGNTVLHVAVGSSTNNQQLIEKLLAMIPPENNSLLDVVNSDGSTLLHVAAIVGNTKAANILLQRNQNLLLAKDNEGHTPLALSLSNMHSETFQCLINHAINHMEKDTLFSGTSGDELLVLAISSKNFVLAEELLTHYKTIHSEAALMAIAQNFPCELNFWERRGVWPFNKKRVGVHSDAFKLLQKICRKIFLTTDHGKHYYTNPLFEATRENAFEVVTEIVSQFPNAIWSTNEDGHNFIQYAVINRSEKIYNLLYQMSDHKNIYKTIKDSSGNNLLHLAARLAPSNKLNLISGAVLQIQWEFQWFKEVEGFVSPLNKIQRNCSDEIPEMVFTREHKDLIIEGEKWMKATAKSCTITAALITTVVFAAVITVPGGNNQDTGVPIFSNNAAFKIFAISDAISLLNAVISLLMFLSILTARFTKQDVLFKLPTKLMIGLTAMVISMIAMIIAFGATLFLVFGKKNSRIPTSIGVLTCLAITFYVMLQVPLIVDLMSATYGRGIFVKKKTDEYFY